MGFFKRTIIFFLILILVVGVSKAEVFDVKEGLVFSTSFLDIPREFDEQKVDIQLEKITVKESGTIELLIKYHFLPPYTNQPPDELLSSYNNNLINGRYAPGISREPFIGTPNFIVLFPTDSYKLENFVVYEEDKIIKSQVTNSNFICVKRDVGCNDFGSGLERRFFWGSAKVLRWKLDTKKDYRIQLSINSNIEINNLGSNYKIELGQIIPFGKVRFSNINIVLPDNTENNISKLSLMTPLINQTTPPKENVGVFVLGGELPFYAGNNLEWGNIEKTIRFEGENNLNLLGTHEFWFTDYYLMNISTLFDYRIKTDEGNVTLTDLYESIEELKEEYLEEIQPLPITTQAPITTPPTTTPLGTPSDTEGFGLGKIIVLILVVVIPSFLGLRQLLKEKLEIFGEIDGLIKSTISMLSGKISKAKQVLLSKLKKK